MNVLLRTDLTIEIKQKL